MTRGEGPVVVGIDGSETSLFALVQAAKEAGWRDVGLHVLHVLDVSPAVLHIANDQTLSTRELAESDREEIWKRSAPALERVEVAVVKVNRDGDPGEVLCAYARETEATLVVVGHVGRGMLLEALLGSTARTVIRRADRNVLLVRS